MSWLTDSSRTHKLKILTKRKMLKSIILHLTTASNGFTKQPTWCLMTFWGREGSLTTRHSPLREKTSKRCWISSIKCIEMTNKFQKSKTLTSAKLWELTQFWKSFQNLLRFKRKYISKAISKLWETFQSDSLIQLPYIID